MKRKLLIFVFCILAIAIVGFAAIVIFAGSIVNKFKPEIQRIASDSTGMKIEIGDIGVSIIPATEVTIRDLTVGGKKDLSLDGVALKVDLLSLLSGSLNISEISIVAPKVKIIQQESGIIIQGLPTPTASNNESAKEKVAAEKAAPAPATQVSSPIKIDLKRIQVRDGLIEVTSPKLSKPLQVADLNFSSAVQLQGSQADIPEISLSTVINEKIKVLVDGTSAKVDLASQAITIPQLSCTINEIKFLLGVNNLGATGGDISVKEGSKIDLAVIKPLLDTIGLSLPVPPVSGEVLPNIAIKAAITPKLSLNGKGVVLLKDIALTQPPIALSKLTGGINLGLNGDLVDVDATDLKGIVGDQPFGLALSSQVNLLQMEINRSDVKLSGFGGLIDLNTKGSITGLNPINNIHRINSLSIGSLVKAVPVSPVPVSGEVKSIEGNIGLSLGANMMSSLSGGTTASLQNIEIEGVNHVANIIGSLKMIPLLGAAILNDLPPSVRSVMNASGTKLNSVYTKLGYSGATIRISDLIADAGVLTVMGDGTASTSGSLDMRAKVALGSDLSYYLISKAKEMQSLSDNTGRIVLPFIISKSANGIVFAPDVEEITKLAAKAFVREGAKKLLQDALSGKKGLFGF